MDEYSVAGATGERFAPPRGSGPALWLEVGARRFPIVDLDRDSCLIDASPTAALRGNAAIFEGEEQLAQCLIMVAAPEGRGQRLIFKRRTEVCAMPAVDFEL
ncbi:MAG TPA: hypothetical protein PKA33_12485 [Amaricoccus sp.]|uniref:hypothetical protein n=1 Tax=Amaricoccus sp. TaxID=1872485 RepID=UPI002B95A8E0|nr:hypothetical protein [Amaricoccus sp.]HMQ94019.1 hypothetical protein [Amaricoccus sp.]HMR53236.1 hypothetical protein [Amaricoccus sp.]HMR61120.1 hypothetical protein [Amaricoccus sp.]HMU00169.1 hypothetical protein [Amaricoccus sp.]